MKIAEPIACYCFNKQCTISIYNRNMALPRYVPVEVALLTDMKCSECGGALYNWLELAIDIEVKEILRVAS
ncbi:hypothetical protein ACFGVR_19145 [Mucilaginibacter sp. AW1-3]